MITVSGLKLLDIEEETGCGNLDQILNLIYTTQCVGHSMQHGFICQYKGNLDQILNLIYTTQCESLNVTWLHLSVQR